MYYQTLYNLRSTVSNKAVFLLFVFLFGLVTLSPVLAQDTTPLEEEAQTTATAGEEGTGGEEASAPAEDTTTDTGETSDETGTDGEDGESTPPTEEGEDATDPPAQTGETSNEGGIEEEGDATEIDTGDATAGLDGTTEENSNNTQTDTPGDSETTVENENDAEADTDATVSAETGDNNALGNERSIIRTGDAVASANIVNVINTNIFNSTGMFYFLNMIMGSISLDIRDMFSILTGGKEVDGGCSIDEEDECEAGDTTVTITNTNNAVVNNTLAVSAKTGGNSASGNNASISTGDAYASANVVNLVNTNITNSNYLLMTVNNFNAGNGNIIFPAADWFQELLNQGSGTAHGSQTTVTNTNDADVSNTAGVGADTGDNSATGDDSLIITGNARAEATIVNEVNTNIFGDSLSFLFKIHGDWAGDIFGLPEGMSWRETNEGVEIFFDGKTAVAPAGSTDNLTVTNTNTAKVNNNVSVFALTGENEANASGDAVIETGNAQAQANIVNVVNSNILGRNWVLAVFNIFGDWDGNIAFGQPDLWVGARALTDDPLRSGSCFGYEVTVNNLGDAEASNVILRGFYSHLQQMVGRFVEDPHGDMSLSVGDIKPGGSSVITLPVCLSEYLSAGTMVETEFVVDSDEDDADESNNREVIGITTVSSGGGALRLGSAELTIEKTADRELIRASSSVYYEITIHNSGDPVYNALLIDTILDQDGSPIHEQRWWLDTIRPDETIIVGYEAFFEGSTTPGVYVNKAFVSGTQHHPNYEQYLGAPVESPVAQVAVTVTEGATESCSQLINTYIRYGGINNSKDVEELQFFLKTLEGFEDVSETGVYDEATYNAVRSFQTKYASDILDPWGMSTPSGYVYYTTQKKVNEIWCDDLDFSLTDEQRNEIDSFKGRSRNFIERTIEPQDDGEYELYGQAPSSDDSYIALSADPAMTQEEQGADILQIANVAQVANSFGGFWNTVRSGITNAFSFLKF